MKHPGKQDNEVRVYTAVFHNCHLINSSILSLLNFFVMKRIPPHISLIPQGASCLTGTQLM